MGKIRILWKIIRNVKMGNIGFVDIGKIQRIRRIRVLAELDSWNCPEKPLSPRFYPATRPRTADVRF